MKDPILRSVGAPFTPATVPIREGELSIGRAEECGVSLPSKAVSRMHARLRRSGEKLTIEDLGSRNGTRRNGAVVEGTSELQIGDRLRFGEYEFVVERPPEESEAATVFDGGAELAATILAPPSTSTPPPSPAPAPSAPAPQPTPPAAPRSPTPPPAAPLPASPAPATVMAPPKGKEPSFSVGTVTPPTVIASDPPAPATLLNPPSKPRASAPAAKPAATPSRAKEKTRASGPSFVGLALIALAAYVTVVAAGYAWWMIAPWD